jgi:vacuolar-type H+-ATPase subunit H
MMKLAETERALLEVVEADRQRRVDAILDEAIARARAILKDAHARARREVRDAVLAARLRAEERLISLRARLATARRLSEQRRAAGILATEWASLPEALLTRWRHPETRRRWARHAARAALSRLPRSGWRIEHPADWPDAERAELAKVLAGDVDAAPSFVSDAAIRAGLRIHSGQNVVDVTFDGLLADREAIGARLLSLTRKEAA